MSSQTDAYAQRFRESAEILHRVADGLDDAAFNWKPSPKSWSVGEVLVHLNKIAKGYAPAFEAAVSDPSAPTAAGPFRYGFLARKFADSLRPGSRPMPTGGPMKPPETDGVRSQIDKARALREFDAYTDRMVAAIEGAGERGLDLGRIKLRSPFLALMRFPLGGWFDAMGLHAVRHALQAERVTEAEGFPA